MFSCIKRIVRNYLDGRQLKKWSNRRDGDKEGIYQVKRSYEDYDLYFDLYWRVFRKDTKKVIGNIYHRADRNNVWHLVQKIEKSELAALLEEHNGDSKSNSPS